MIRVAGGSRTPPSSTTYPTHPLLLGGTAVLAGVVGRHGHDVHSTHHVHLARADRSDVAGELARDVVGRDQLRAWAPESVDLVGPEVIEVGVGDQDQVGRSRILPGSPRIEVHGPLRVLPAQRRLPEPGSRARPRHHPFSTPGRSLTDRYGRARIRPDGPGTRGHDRAARQHLPVAAQPGLPKAVPRLGDLVGRRLVPVRRDHVADRRDDGARDRRGSRDPRAGARVLHRVAACRGARGSPRSPQVDDRVRRGPHRRLRVVPVRRRRHDRLAYPLLALLSVFGAPFDPASTAATPNLVDRATCRPRTR